MYDGLFKLNFYQDILYIFLSILTLNHQEHNANVMPKYTTLQKFELSIFYLFFFWKKETNTFIIERNPYTFLFYREKEWRQNMYKNMYKNIYVSLYDGKNTL